MRKIMRTHNRIIPRSLPLTPVVFLFLWVLLDLFIAYICLFYSELIFDRLTRYLFFGITESLLTILMCLLCFTVGEKDILAS